MLPLDSTYSYGTTGLGVTIYVIDTGLLSTHVEFTGRVRPGMDFVNDGNGTLDCNGHGTHVAGTAAGTTYGVAKQATIVPVRVLNCGGSGPASRTVAGITWVIGDHLAGVPAVANLSLGGPASAMTDAAINALVADGVTVVVAAGNDDDPSCDSSPGRVANAITVAASEIDDDRAGYSNFGPCNDIFAPGTGVLSAVQTSDTATGTKNGTSMASPHVAGAAARLLQTSPTMTPADVWAALDSSSTKGALDLNSSPGGDPNKLLYVAPPSANPPPPPPPAAAPTSAAPTSPSRLGSRPRHGSDSGAGERSGHGRVDGRRSRTAAPRSRATPQPRRRGERHARRRRRRAPSSASRTVCRTR